MPQTEQYELTQPLLFSANKVGAEWQGEGVLPMNLIGKTFHAFFTISSIL